MRISTKTISPAFYSLRETMTDEEILEYQQGHNDRMEALARGEDPYAKDYVPLCDRGETDVSGN